MTGKEALAGFQELSRHFNKGYKGGELNPVWEELLGYSHAAFVRAVGIAKKNLRFLPEVDYIMEQTRWWNMNLKHQVAADQRRAGGGDPGAEGREMFRIVNERLAGELSDQEYAARLYAMSEKYKKPEYAVTARQIEDQLERGKHVF